MLSFYGYFSIIMPFVVSLPAFQNFYFIYDPAAGAIGFALGTEFRHDKATYDINTELAKDFLSLEVAATEA